MELQYYRAGNAGGMKYFSLEYERKRGEPGSFTCTIKALKGKVAHQIGTVAITPENSGELTQDFPVNDGSTLVFLVSLFSALSQPGVAFAPNFSFCFGLVFRLALIVVLISSVFAMKDLHDDRRIEQKRIKTTPFALLAELRQRT